MKLLSSRCNPILTKVNPHSFPNWRISQVLLHQEGTCDCLAAQTPWAGFSRGTFVFRLPLCVFSHAACAYPTDCGVVGDAEAIQLLEDICRCSATYMKNSATVNWSLNTCLAVSVLFSEEKTRFLLCLMEHGVLIHPVGKGLVALTLYHQNSYPNFSFIYFALDIRPKPIFRAEFSKLETEFGKSKKCS